MNIVLENGERIEDLQCRGLKIIQNKDLYTFTGDSVVLANFVDIKAKDKCVEIGAGSGVISILLTAKTPVQNIKAFELQPSMADLAKKNVLLNDLDDKIEVICDDVKNFGKYIEKASVDVVFSNPPYMKSGLEQKEDVRAIARHDKTLPIEMLCSSTSQMLKMGGKFYVVYTAERTAELVVTLAKNNLEPKRMFFTENGKGRVVLVVIEAVKGGKKGVKVLPQLTTNDMDGKYLEILQTKYVK